MTPTSIRLLPFPILLTILADCGAPDDAAVAARGEIDHFAPIQATVRVAINAPPALVWTVLSDIARWPAWQTDIQATAVAAPVAADTMFRWTTSGATIDSRIVLFEPGRRLAWIGHLLVFRAVHVWTLAAVPDGTTAVTTTESLSGWPIALFCSSDELRQSDQRWLDLLRHEAERPAAGQSSMPCRMTSAPGGHPHAPEEVRTGRSRDHLLRTAKRRVPDQERGACEVDLGCGDRI